MERRSAEGYGSKGNSPSMSSGTTVNSDQLDVHRNPRIGRNITGIASRSIGKVRRDVNYSPSVKTHADDALVQALYNLISASCKCVGPVYRVSALQC